MPASRLDITIGSKDKTAKGFAGVKQRIGKLGASLGQSAKNVAKGVAIAATAATAALGAMVKSQLSAVDDMAKLSDRLDISTESLSGLGHAATIAGSSQQEMSKALEQMNKRIGEAAGGTGVAKDTLEELGISLEDIIDLPADEKFKLISDKFKELPSAAQKASAANDLFGRSGLNLINTLELGSEGLADMQEEAEKLGITFSRQDAAKVEQANDAMARVKASIAGVARVITIEIAPILAKIFGKIAEKIPKITEALKGAVFNIKIAFLSLSRDIILAFDKMAQGVVGSINKILEVAANIPGVEGFAPAQIDFTFLAKAAKDIDDKIFEAFEKRSQERATAAGEAAAGAKPAAAAAAEADRKAIDESLAKRPGITSGRFISGAAALNNDLARKQLEALREQIRLQRQEEADRMAAFAELRTLMQQMRGKILIGGIGG